jgi:glycosyltransferase involved in cell wall biosynthesis
MAKLSIITINYNNKKGLEKTITSVVHQSFADYEYIIIDGGSTDGSVDVIKQYSDRVNYWVSEPDKGIYNAMNKGIRKATGEYCLFLNSGDKFTDKYILNKVFSISFSEDLVYGNTLYDNMCQSYPENISLTYLISKSLPHQSTFIKKSLFESIGFYDEENRIVSDWEFFLKAIQLHSCSYKYLSGITISKLESPGISQQMKHITTRNAETEKVFKSLIIPILQKKLKSPEEHDEINEVFIKLYHNRDSKLVRQALKFENSKFFNSLRRIYYRLNKSN